MYKSIDLSISVFIPTEPATDQKIEEWVKFQLGAIGGISIENPLHEHDMECDINNLMIR